MSDKVFRGLRDRPELNRILDQLRAVDVLIVWKLDLLARSTRKLLETIKSISDAEARIRFISERRAETTTHARKVITTIFTEIAEFECDLIRERAGSGRGDAQKRCVRFCRPRKMNESQVKLAPRLFKEGNFARELAGTFSILSATLYRSFAPAT